MAVLMKRAVQLAYLSFAALMLSLSLATWLWVLKEISKMTLSVM